MANARVCLSPDDVRQILNYGDYFVKYKYGQTKNRFVWCDEDLRQLRWNPKRTDSDWVKGFIWIKDITTIHLSSKHCTSQDEKFTDLMLKNAGICLSIVTPLRTVDVECRTGQVRNRFALALIIRRLEIQTEEAGNFQARLILAQGGESAFKQHGEQNPMKKDFTLLGGEKQKMEKSESDTPVKKISKFHER